MRIQVGSMNSFSSKVSMFVDLLQFATLSLIGFGFRASFYLDN